MIDTLKIPRAWLAIPLALLTGCTTEYAWDVDQKTGQVYLADTRQVFSPEKAQQVAVGVAGVVDGVAGAAGAYARGYAQASQMYQSPPPITTSSGLIFGPNGQTSMYNINNDGYGAVYGPNGQTTLVSPHALYGPNGQTTIISGN